MTEFVCPKFCVCSETAIIACTGGPGPVYYAQPQTVPVLGAWSIILLVVFLAIVARVFFKRKHE